MSAAGTPPPRGGLAPMARATGLGAHDGTANLADVLERVLDKGIVIAGDIQVNLLDIELLTIKLRLIVASVDTARRMGICWWESDPWLVSDNGQADRDSLGERVERPEHRLERGRRTRQDEG
jgi:Gas vesicle protein